MSEQLPPPEAHTDLPPPAPRRRTATGGRWLRALAPVGIVAVALGGFAVAQAAIDDSGNDSPSDLIENAAPTTSTSLPDDTPGGVGSGGLGGGDVQRNVTFIDDAIADGSTQTFSAGAAGTVTIARAGTTLTVVSAVASPGWTAVVEAGSGLEVEVKFTTTNARIDLEAEIEDGGVRVRVRERTAVLPGTTDPVVTDPTAPRTDNSGPGSIDDDFDDSPDVDDDHRGSGRGSDDSPDVDDDHGGSGSGSDDSPDVDDDHSGSGRGSDDDPDVDDDHGGSGSGSGSSGSGTSGSGRDD